MCTLCMCSFCCWCVCVHMSSCRPFCPGQQRGILATTGSLMTTWPISRAKQEPDSLVPGLKHNERPPECLTRKPWGESGPWGQSSSRQRCVSCVRLLSCTMLLKKKMTKARSCSNGQSEESDENFFKASYGKWQKEHCCIEISDQAEEQDENSTTPELSYETTYFNVPMRRSSVENYMILLNDKTQLAYPGKVCSILYPVHHLLTLRVHSSHMGPHPLPGDAFDGETSPVDIKKNSSILLLFLPRGPGTVIRGRGGGFLLGAAAEEAVRACALWSAVPAQFGRGSAGPAWGVGSCHWSQES